MKPGPLIILSGPSGSGKSTVIRALLTESPFPLRQSISATTRPPRPGEVNGRDYHFVSEEQFRLAIEAGELLEWARVYGNYYGTPRNEVDAFRERGFGVILVIDVQGAALVRAQYPDSLTVFLTTSTPEIYEQRLRARGTEDEASLLRRLKTAARELARQGDYRYTVYNDDLAVAVRQLRERIEPKFTNET